MKSIKDSIIDTKMVLDFILARERRTFEGQTFGVDDIEFHIIGLLNTERFITFLWRELRKTNSVSSVFNDLDINIMSSAGRVMITFQADEDFISYLGDQKGYGAGFQACKIGTRNGAKEDAEYMAQRIESFVNAFSPECLAYDSSLRIAIAPNAPNLHPSHP